MKKLLAMAGLGSTPSREAASAASYEPYAEPHVNSLYNLLFCDDLELFRNERAARADGPWAALMAEKADEKALRAVAGDESEESRTRVLAYNRLRAEGLAVAPKTVLGVIVEVPLQQGLDVLAAYADGRVRYLNQSGKVSICEPAGKPPVEAMAKELVALSAPLVQQIGPWDKKRLPPPKGGNVRMTFLVSDGLYFGEGPFQALQRDPMGGPVLRKAADLLRLTVDTSLKGSAATGRRAP